MAAERIFTTIDLLESSRCITEAIYLSEAMYFRDDHCLHAAL
jgi:hypothetical protein